MRRAKILYKGEPAGTLSEISPDRYVFRYYSTWFEDDSKPSISITLPKTMQEYESRYLFSFFFNMLSEGYNREQQCRKLQIDENDDFGLLLATAHTDTIGAVTVERFKEDE